MKFKTYTGITWSVLELSGLLEDEDSRVYYEKIKKHLGLHPFHLTNLNAALNEILSSNLNLYDPELKGFLLAYKNPKLLTPLGEIFYDTCFIHIDIEADFYIFRPEVGCSLKGIVNKKGLSHLGVLVHKAFNVSIPKPEGEEDWPGDKVDIGQEIRFEVTHLDFTSRLPFIRGALHKEEYLKGCRLSDVHTNISNRRISVDNESENDVGTSNNEVQDAPRQNNPRPFFTSDSESSSNEDLHRSIQKKQSKKSRQLNKNSISSDDESETSHKTCAKKPAEAKKKSHNKHKTVKAQVLPQDPLSNSTMNDDDDVDDDNDVDVDDINRPMETSISKNNLKKCKGHGLESNIQTEENKKFEKGLKKKLDKKPSKTITNDTLVKIKKERMRTSSSSENVMDEETYLRKIKSEKEVANKQQLDNIDCSAHNSDLGVSAKSFTKKPKKKIRISESESENVCINVKQEESTALSNTISNQDVKINQNTKQSQTKKKQRKTHKYEAETEAHNSEFDNESSVRYSKESLNSTVFDPDSETPAVKIKKEKNHEVHDTASAENSRKSKRKSSNRLLETPTVSEIKKERIRTNSGMEYVTDEDTHLRMVKAEKEFSNRKENANSISEEQSPNLQTHIESPNKRPSKKCRTSESEGENVFINVKREKSTAVYNQGDTEDADVGKSTQPPTRKQSKKDKHATRTENHDSEIDKKSPKKRSPQEGFLNSTVFDPDTEIPMIEIKTENTYSDYKDVYSEDEAISEVTPLQTSILNTLTSNINELEESEGKKRKKKMKKHTKTVADIVKTEPALEDITIKIEKPDNITDAARKKTDVKESLKTNFPKKKHFAVSENSTQDAGAILPDTKEYMKKAKTMDKVSKTHTVKVKTENDNSNVPKELVMNNESNSSVSTDYDNAQRSAPSSRKYSKKLKKFESGVEHGNIKIKIEQFTDS